MHAWVLVVLGWLFGTQAVNVHADDTSPRTGSRMDIQRSADVCSTLTPSECCAQMLEIALFRATGDYVPKSAKMPLRLSCEAPRRTIPENACRLLALGRGLSATEATQLCAPDKLAQRCSDDAACKQCVSDLGRLEWKAPVRACYALTYVAKPSAADSADNSRTQRLVRR
ncbi:MAG: hypothetical protein RL701_4326 [Pseudomonadota bacterium]